MSRVLKCIFILVFFVGLSGCAEQLFFPRFDGGLLNPDIRFLRASDVVNGMKCAFVAFMQEREQQLIQERVANPKKFADIEAKGKIDDGFGKQGETHQLRFSPYSINRTWQPECGLGGHFALCPANPKSGEQKELARRCAQSRTQMVPDRGIGICVENTSCSPLSQRFWDYSVAKFPEDHQRNKEPTYRGCRAVPDYSRFALDPTQNAKIQLTLMGTNSGFANYNKIDITKMGSFINFVVPGGGARGDPFPGLRFDGNGATTFDLSVNIPQSLVGPRQPDPYPLWSSSFSNFAPADLKIATGLRDKWRVNTGVVNNFAADQQLFIAEGAPPVPTVDSAIGTAMRVSTQLFQKDHISDKLFEAIEPSRRAPVFAELREVFKKVRALVKVQILDVLDAQKVETATGPPRLLRAWTVSFADTAQAVADQDLRSANKAVGELRRATSDLGALVTLQGSLGELAKAADTQNGLKEVDSEGTDKKLGLLQLQARDLNDEAARTLFTNQLKDAREEVADARATILARRAETAVPVSTPAVVTRSPQAQAALSKEGGDLKWFESYCSAAPGEGHENVDYLALKRLLHTVVEEQNETLYRGSPPVTMDSLVLTSKFQITLEATAGTHGIFRILPLLAAPNMELKADHVHTLKITLAGGKKKGDPNVKYQLSCEERLQKKTPPGGRGGRRWPQRWGLRQHRRAIARKHPGNPRVKPVGGRHPVIGP